MSEKTISESARVAAMETTHPSGDPRFAALVAKSKAGSRKAFAPKDSGGSGG